MILTGEIVALRDAYAFTALFLDGGTRSKETMYEPSNVLFEKLCLRFPKKGFPPQKIKDLGLNGLDTMFFVSLQD